MLEEKDLQAIGQMMTQVKQDILSETTQMMSQVKQEILTETSHNMKVLIEAEFTPKFNLLAEGQQDILDKLVPRSRVEELEDEVKFLKVVIRQITEDVQLLKQAN